MRRSVLSFSGLLMLILPESFIVHLVQFVAISLQIQSDPAKSQSGQAGGQRNLAGDHNLA